MNRVAVTLTAADNGRTVDVREGDTLVLRLHENASTGYRWAFDGLDPTYLDVQDGEYVGQADAVGGGGQAHWTLVAKARGIVEIRLKLWRRWEGERSVRERFGVTLKIG